MVMIQVLEQLLRSKLAEVVDYDIFMGVPFLFGQLWCWHRYCASQMACSLKKF